MGEKQCKGTRFLEHGEHKYSDYQEVSRGDGIMALTWRQHTLVDSRRQLFEQVLGFIRRPAELRVNTNCSLALEHGPMHVSALESER